MYAVWSDLLPHFHALGVGMAFDLQHGRLYRRFPHDSLKHLVVGIEIADAERADLSHSHSLFHVFPCTHEISHGLMDI